MFTLFFILYFYIILIKENMTEVSDAHLTCNTDLEHMLTEVFSLYYIPILY